MNPFLTDSMLAQKIELMLSNLLVTACGGYTFSA